MIGNGRLIPSGPLREELDSLKKNDFKKAEKQIKKFDNLNRLDRFNVAVLESLKQYIYVFNKKKILENKKNLGKLSEITETFQRCYLGDDSTNSYFEISNGLNEYTGTNLFNSNLDNSKIWNLNTYFNDIEVNTQNNSFLITSNFRLGYYSGSESHWGEESASNYSSTINVGYNFSILHCFQLTESSASFILTRKNYLIFEKISSFFNRFKDFRSTSLGFCS